jgi:hypothetical protein
VCFSPDGTRIASESRAESGEIKLWDAATGEEVHTLRGHTGYVSSVCFSPDGTRIAAASSDHTIRLWDAPRDEDLEEFQRRRGLTLSRPKPHWHRKQLAKATESENWFAVAFHMERLIAITPENRSADIADRNYDLQSLRIRLQAVKARLQPAEVTAELQQHLLQPLTEIYADEQWSDAWRKFAAESLADYQNAAGLFELLAISSRASDYRLMFAGLQRRHNKAPTDSFILRPAAREPFLKSLSVTNLWGP